MLLGESNQKTLHDIIELLIWSQGYININEIHELPCEEFMYLRNIFKEKFTKEQEQKQEFIKNTFEFAKKGIEAICKTIANVFGGKK